MSFALLVVASSVSAAVVHPARQAHIDAVNAASTTWRAAAHPRFAAAPPGASAPMLGAKGDMKLEVAAAKARGDVVDYVPRGGAAPEAFDSAARWPECAKLIGDIRDQSNCGCCWAFAGAEAASDRQCIATGGAVAVPLSAQDVCFNANVDGCDGGQIITPWTYVAKAGAVTGGQYNGTGPFGAGLCADWFAPHCHHHGPRGDDPYPAEGDAGCPSEKSPKGPEACGATAAAGHDAFAADKHTFAGDVQTASGEAAIMAMIAEGGPVETAFTAKDRRGDARARARAPPPDPPRALGLRGLRELRGRHLPPRHRRGGRRPRREIRRLGRRERHQVLEGRELLEPLLGRGGLLPHPPRQQRGRHRGPGHGQPRGRQVDARGRLGLAARPGTRPRARSAPPRAASTAPSRSSSR